VTFLQRTGWIVAVAAIPPVVECAASSHLVMVASSVSPVMAKLSSYRSEASHQAWPDDVAEKAKHHILDAIAAMVSGSERPPGRAMLYF
jgi:hypothetical protein